MTRSKVNTVYLKWNQKERLKENSQLKAFDILIKFISDFLLDWSMSKKNVYNY